MLFPKSQKIRFVFSQLQWNRFFWEPRWQKVAIKSRNQHRKEGKEMDSAKNYQLVTHLPTETKVSIESKDGRVASVKDSSYTGFFHKQCLGFPFLLIKVLLPGDFCKFIRFLLPCRFCVLELFSLGAGLLFIG